MKYADIDIVDVEDVKCTINKIDYLVPGDLPFKCMVKIIKWSKKYEENPTDTEAMEKFSESIYDILKIRKSDLKLDTIVSWGMNKMVSAYSFIVNGTPPKETMGTIEEKKIEVKKKAE